MTIKFINNCSTPHEVFYMLPIIKNIIKSILIEEIDANYIVLIRNSAIMKYGRGR